jgi:hypothetical protein
MQQRSQALQVQQGQWASWDEFPLAQGAHLLQTTHAAVSAGLLPSPGVWVEGGSQGVHTTARSHHCTRGWGHRARVCVGRVRLWGSGGVNAPWAVLASLGTISLSGTQPYW